VAAAHEVTTHLLHLGHTRIALLIDETDWTTGKGRLQGYVDAHREAEVEVDDRLILRCGFDIETVSAQARSLLASGLRPTALFAANNLLAELAWREIAHAQLRIPADLSLVGFDDAPWMSMVTPSITTVAQPAFALGGRAARVLLSRITTPARARTVRLGSRLIERGSTAAPVRLRAR
jgi:DNA-binding LacI/PurR family transcriptional regulator